MNEYVEIQSNTNPFTIYTPHSSPVIERVNINNIFHNALVSVRPTPIMILADASNYTTIPNHINTPSYISTPSPLIQAQTLHDNRHYSIIENTLV